MHGKILGITLTLLLSGCATYHALPLPQQANLRESVAALDHTVSDPSSKTGRKSISLTPPLDIDRIGLLAILNNPDLRAQGGEMNAAQAGLLQASLLPNPSVNLSYAALLGGPGTTAAYSASISQNVTALLTYHNHVASARAKAGQINADLLWKQWQVAQKARLLALDIYWQEHSLRLTKRQLTAVDSTIKQVDAATRSGSLDLSALAPLQVSQASLQQSLVSLRQKTLQNWQALDALLGLTPDTRFAIAEPDLKSLPDHLDALTANLPQRRPDLVALQLGYRAANEDVRAAILGQFPALVLGGSWGSDTTQVRSGGPTITFDLPIFDRNQGKIAQTRATRLILHQQYQSRLDGAVATVQALATQWRQLSVAVAQARAAQAAAVNNAKAAQAAYQQDNLDQRSLTDYENTALQRDIELSNLQRSLGETRIALSLELGQGLPKARIPLPQQKPRT